MTTTLPMREAGMRPNSMFEHDLDRTIARFESELATHRLEEARLRIALARAEALLLERMSFVPDAAETAGQRARQGQFASCSANLTPRQREIMKLVLEGHPSKNIAADLGISRRTVENHRAAIMRKTGSKSLPALGRFGLITSPPNAPGPFVVAGTTLRF
jgi:DNA-binding CsgD family transcriptional regulator